MLVQGWACELSQDDENQLNEILELRLEHLEKRCLPSSKIAEDINGSFSGYLSWGEGGSGEAEPA